MVARLLGIACLWISMDAFASVHHFPYDASKLDPVLTKETSDEIEAEPRSGCKEGVMKRYPFQKDIGQNYAVHLYADLEMGYGCQQAAVDSLFELDFALQDTKIKALTARVVAQASQLEALHTRSVMVMGYEIHAHRSTYALGQNWAKKWTLPLDYQKTIPMMIGPLKVQIEMGMVGQARFSYAMGTGILAAQGHMLPTVSSEAYLRAGVGGFGVAKVMVDGSLIMAEGGVDLKGSAQVLNKDTDPMISLLAHASSTLTGLKGDLVVKATALSQDIYEKELFKWHGFVYDDTYLDVDKKIPAKFF